MLRIGNRVRRRIVGIVPPGGEGRAAATEFARRPTFSPSTNRSHFRSGSRQLTLGEQEQYRRPRRGRGAGGGTRRLKRWKSRGNTQVAQAPRGDASSSLSLALRFHSLVTEPDQTIRPFFLSFFLSSPSSRLTRIRNTPLFSTTEFSILPIIIIIIPGQFCEQRITT